MSYVKPEMPQSILLMILADQWPSKECERHYNSLTAKEVAAIVIDPDADLIQKNETLLEVE